MIREVAKKTEMVNLQKEPINLADGPGSNQSWNFDKFSQKQEEKKESQSYKEAEESAFKDLTMP